MEYFTCRCNLMWHTNTVQHAYNGNKHGYALLHYLRELPTIDRQTDIHPTDQEALIYMWSNKQYYEQWVGS